MRLNQIDKKTPPSQTNPPRGKSPKKPAKRVNKKKNARSLRVYADYMRFFVSFIAIVMIIFLWFQGYPQQLYIEMIQKFHSISSSLGFRVQEIVVQGRVHTKQQDLMKVLKIDRGDPIFMIDLQQTRFHLEKLEWVRQATVIRHLPDLIHIKIEERHPIAIWQHQKAFHLVDQDGTAILTKDYRNYGVLPLLVGEGAPQKSTEILELLAGFPSVQKNLQALSRVRERRWNVYLIGGIVVKLSDRSLKQGLEILEKLLKDQRLSVNNIHEVDLRTPERYFLRVTPETIERIKANRKGRMA